MVSLAHLLLLALLTAPALANAAGSRDLFEEAGVKFGPFANQGAPPFIKLPTAATDENGEICAMGLWRGDTIASVVQRGDEPFSLTNVTYLSWECGPTELPGSYYAVLDKSRITRNLTTTTKGPLCELGVVDLAAGTNSWAQSAEGCPQPGVELQVDLLLSTEGVENEC